MIPTRNLMKNRNYSAFTLPKNYSVNEKYKLGKASFQKNPTFEIFVHTNLH